MTLSRWHVTASESGRCRVAVQILDDVDVHSCAEVAGVLTCLTAADRLSVWRLPPS